MVGPGVAPPPAVMSGVRRTFLFLPLILLTASPGVAQGRSTTRIEQGDRSIVYSGNWYANDSADHSGTTAALTNAPGARASVTFTGTGIAWIGVTDGWSGLATVYLDGEMKVVDTYSETAAYQRAIYEARGLSPGPHTLSIEVTHERGPGTDGSWVWIDAFDIENGTGLPGGIPAPSGRVEENNPALVFTGRWYSRLNPAYSGGGSVLSMDAGSRLSLSFDGTGIAWVAYRDEWSGIARVYVDGELKTTIDNYLAPSQTGVVPYSIGGLGSGTHTLTIEATGTRNSSSQGAWIWVDAFDVTR
jgi:hypothetical protein